MTNYKQHCIKLLQILDTNWPLGLPATWEKWADAARAALAEPTQPQSLADPALKALTHLLRHSSTELGSETIRRALERLQELEEQKNG